MLLFLEGTETFTKRWGSFWSRLPLILPCQHASRYSWKEGGSSSCSRAQSKIVLVFLQGCFVGGFLMALLVRLRLAVPLNRAL